MILVMADEIARQRGICFQKGDGMEVNPSIARKKKAFQNMLEMREKSIYPKEFDYKKVMEEAIVEKYNIIN